jgi:hypothetical protein
MRDVATQYANETAIEGMQFASREPDTSGVWITVRDGRWPLMQFSFLFEDDGTASGYRVEPFQPPGLPRAESGRIVYRDQRHVPLEKLEHFARRYAKLGADLDVAAAAATYTIVRTDGSTTTAPLAPGGGPGSRMHDRAVQVADALADTRRRGGPVPRLDDRFYAEVARAYVDALPTGKANKVTAEALFCSAKQVQNYVAEARSRGYLSPTSRGVAGGVLTDKALAVLAMNNDKGTK